MLGSSVKEERVSQDSSFTDEQRALWYRARRLGVDPAVKYGSEELDEIEEDQNESEDGESLQFSQGASCIQCGAPIQDGLQPGYEAGLCSACD